MTISDLPGFNAAFNAISTVFIVLGWIFISKEMKRQHIAMMICALIASTIFLGGYLTYHFSVGEAVTRFEEQGAIRVLYFAILVPHIILAFFVPPLVLMTVIPAIGQRFDKHRRIAKWTMPIWLYVSVTGVLVYLMLYKWYPPASVLAGNAS